MDEEILDIFDESGKVVGTMKRSETEKMNHIIQNALIFVFNSKGEVWVQKRAMSKKHFPGLWDISACGAVASGEDPTVAAERETEEETGLKVKLTHIETFLNVFDGDDNKTYKRLSHLYIGVSEGQAQTNEEVDEFKAVHYDQLVKDIKQNPKDYVPSFLLELEKASEAFKKN